MPIALAGLASVLWGTADFLGGFAASGWRAERVAGLSQLIGLVLMVVLAIAFTGAIAPVPDLAWGAVAGVTGGVGGALLYRSLAIGPMNATAPTVAVVTALVPAAIGIVQGERPGGVALVGVAVAVVAVALVGGASAPGPDEPRATIHVLLIAAGAGVGLGLANAAFAQTSVDAGLWPVAATKLVAGVVLWGYVFATPRATDRPRARRNVTSAFATGMFDAGATMSLALALQRGSLVLVSVLGSLFPAVTVVLARFVLHERIGRAQAVGLGLALAAVAMIVGG